MAEAASIVRRVLFAGLVLATAAGAMAQSAAAIIAKDDPEAALQLNSRDAVAIVFNMDRLLQGQGAGGDVAPEELAKSGRAALLSAPLSAGGLRLIGLSAGMAGDRQKATRLMALSTAVSRRDLSTQVWLIEDRVTAGDVPGVLDHYDVALSTNEYAAGLLFPVLSAALGNDQIRTAFSPLIGQRRPWMVPFLTFAIANGETPQYLAEMILARGGLPRDADYRPVETLLLGRLGATRQYSTARQFALSLPGVTPATLTEAGFTDRAMDTALAPLTWQFATQSDVRAARDGSSQIVVQARTDTRGLAAFRTLFLTPGEYSFVQTVAPVAEQDVASIRWELRCLTDKADIVWSQDVAAPRAESQARYPVHIPVGCGVQQLTLTVSGGGSQADSSLRVGPIHLEPSAGS